MGEKGGSSAPSPDPMIGKAAWQQAMTGEKWLDFSKQFFADSVKRQDRVDELTEEVTRQHLDRAKEQEAWAREDRDRYKNTFQPLEDEFIAEAKNYGSSERQAQAAAEAKADVQTSAAQAREANLRQSSALGINPASGRYAGIDRATELATGLASAGAQNNARNQIRDKGLALKADIANMGRGLPAQAAASTALGLQAGAGAVGMNQNNQQLFNSSGNIMNAGFSGAMQGWAGAGNTMNSQYRTQVAAWDAEQRLKAANAGGIGSFIGGLAGLASGGGIFSDKNLKENKQPIEEGKALQAVKELPVEEWDYRQGVADEGHHIGTYAQDFKQATGQGDGHTINLQDAVGLTMKAVQDLDKKVEQMARPQGLGKQNRPKRKEKSK